MILIDNDTILEVFRTCFRLTNVRVGEDRMTYKVSRWDYWRKEAEKVISKYSLPLEVEPFNRVFYNDLVIKVKN